MEVQGLTPTIVNVLDRLTVQYLAFLSQLVFSDAFHFDESYSKTCMKKQAREREDAWETSPLDSKQPLSMRSPRYLLVFTFVDVTEKKFFATHEVAEMQNGSFQFSMVYQTLPFEFVFKFQETYLISRR